MPSDRIQRRVDRLKAEAIALADSEDWGPAARSVEQAIILAPGDEEARSLFETLSARAADAQALGSPQRAASTRRSSPRSAQTAATRSCRSEAKKASFRVWSAIGVAIVAAGIFAAIVVAQRSDVRPDPTEATPLPTARALVPPPATAIARTPVAAPAERVALSTTVETEYYTVRGQTASAIFESIEGSGLVDQDGQLASGLTEYAPSWETFSASYGGFSCLITAVEFRLDVTVTLPRHVNAPSLSPALRGRWNTFAESVRQHEERHVNIELEQAESLQRSIESLQSWSDCDRFERDLNVAIEAYTTEKERLHDAFHVEEDSELARKRGGLEAAIATSEAQLDSIESELAAIDTQIAAIEARYPSLVLPEPEYSEYQALASRYNRLVTEYNGIVNASNELIEDLLWVR